jgi:hypothetical protein
MTIQQPGDVLLGLTGIRHHEVAGVRRFPPYTATIDTITTKTT